MSTKTRLSYTGWLGWWIVCLCLRTGQRRKALVSIPTSMNLKNLPLISTPATSTYWTKSTSSKESLASWDLFARITTSTWGNSPSTTSSKGLTQSICMAILTALPRSPIKSKAKIGAHSETNRILTGWCWKAWEIHPSLPETISSSNISKNIGVLLILPQNHGAPRSVHSEK